MKIITVNINKGGTGKSTISYTLAKWLTSKKNKKVLLVDGDRSCNLSFSFSLSNSNESSILDVFTREKEIDIAKINDNLDFIRGSNLLEDNELNLKSKQNNCMLFFMWIADNMEQLKKYDYMIIDTHNDKSLVTSNFLAVADVVLGVSEPSRNGFRAWLELGETIDFLKDELVDIISRKTYVTAEPFLIANKVEHIGNTSKQFLEMVELEKNYIGMIQKKEILAKTLLEDKSIFEMQVEMTPTERKRNEAFFENINNLFEHTMKIVDEKE